MSKFKVYAGASPQGGDAHVDVPLSNFAVRAFDAGEEGMVANELFPEIGVGKQSDKYYVIEKDAFLRVPNTLRAPRAKPRRVNFTVSSDSYFANNYALATDNALEDLSNADTAIQLRQNGTDLVVGLLRKDQEVRVANIVTSISNVGSGVTLSGSNKWGDPQSNPMADVTTAHAFIRSQTGLVANTAVVDWDTLMILRRHPDLLDMYKYTSGGELNDGQIKEVLRVSKLLVPHGIKENALEGGTSSLTNVWGNVCVLARIGPATGVRSITAGGRFRWKNPIYPANFGVLTNVENRAGEAKVEVLEAGFYQDEKVIARDLMYTIGTTL